MKYSLLALQEAEDDIVDIYGYIAHAHGPERAAQILSLLQESCGQLNEMPGRGYIPSELERLGIRDFREIHIKPHRTIYQVAGRKINIHAVLDGRRSLQELLERRLLRPPWRASGDQTRVKSMSNQENDHLLINLMLLVANLLPVFMQFPLSDS